jgi:hypothetical protein
MFCIGPEASIGKVPESTEQSHLGSPLMDTILADVSKYIEYFTNDGEDIDAGVNVNMHTQRMAPSLPGLL